MVRVLASLLAGIVGVFVAGCGASNDGREPIVTQPTAATGRGPAASAPAKSAPTVVGEWRLDEEESFQRSFRVTTGDSPKAVQMRERHNDHRGEMAMYTGNRSQPSFEEVTRQDLRGLLGGGRAGLTVRADGSATLDIEFAGAKFDGRWDEKDGVLVLHAGKREPFKFTRDGKRLQVDLDPLQLVFSKP